MCMFPFEPDEGFPEDPFDDCGELIDPYEPDTPEADEESWIHPDSE